MSNVPTKNPDRVNNFGIVLIGLTSAVLLWVSVVALQAYYGSTAGAVELERLATNQNQEVRELKAQQSAGLKEYRWVDPKAKTLAIPVETAMALVLRDAKGGAASLVPAVGTHDVATVPAAPGRPADNVAAPATAAPTAPAPATPAGGAATPGQGGTPPGATPTSEASAANPSTAAQPQAPVPATPSKAGATPAKPTGGPEVPAPPAQGVGGTQDKPSEGLPR
jgi:hypothetical protein